MTELEKELEGRELTPLESACLEYLETRPFTLWADWDIKRPERRLEAAVWLASQYRAVNRVLGT